MNRPGERFFRDLKFEVAEGRASGSTVLRFRGTGGKDLKVKAGAPGTWEIIFTVGAGGIPEGGRIAFARKYDSGGFEGFRLALRPQTFNPKGVDYVTVSTDGDAELSVEADRSNIKAKEIAVVRVKRGLLREGDIVTLRIGDRRHGGAGSFAWPVERMGCLLLTYVDREGDGRFRLVDDEPVSVEVVAGDRLAKFNVVPPSELKPGENFDIRIAALDENANLITSYRGKVSIKLIGEDGTEAERSEVFPAGGEGRLTVGWRVPREGVHWVEVKDGEGGASSIGGPILCGGSGADLRTFWGDIHAHTYDAVEIVPLDEITHPRSVLLMGRDRNFIDICALSPHYFPRHADAFDHVWELIAGASRELYSPGAFVTFPCFEYRGEGGDRNLLFFDEDAGPVKPSERIADLWDKVSGREIIVIPHVGGGTSDWDLHNPEFEPVAEIASSHGNFEWFIQEALSRGYRIGVIASSDDHNRTAGHPRRIQMGGGRYGSILNRRDASFSGASLMAVKARKLTREDVWEAMRSRRVYGTTGARMLIDFRIDGHPMGSEVSTSGLPKISARAIGNAPILRLEVIRGDRLFHVHHGSSMSESLELVDENPISGTTYYYLRVTQRDGEIGWSSPIWVTYTGPERPERELPPWNYDEIIEWDPVPREEAEKCLKALKDYLEREESPDIFVDLRFTGIVKSPQGRYAYIVGWDTVHDLPMHANYYLDFPDERVRFDLGWRHFGAYSGRPPVRV